jgi:hypothetical protein
MKRSAKSDQKFSGRDKGGAPAVGSEVRGASNRSHPGPRSDRMARFVFMQSNKFVYIYTIKTPCCSGVQVSLQKD